MHYVDEGPADGRGRPAAARPAHLVVPLPHGGGPPGRARACAPWPRTSSASVARTSRWHRTAYFGAGPRRLAGAVRRRRRPRRRDAGRPGLGRPHRAGPSCAHSPGLVRRVVAANTALHTADPALAGRLDVGLPRRPGRHRHRGADAARLPAPHPGAHAVPPRASSCREPPSRTCRTTSWRPTTPRSPTRPSAPGPRQLPLLMGLTPASACARLNRRTMQTLAGVRRPVPHRVLRR